jgi:hypothetical protein
MQISQTMLDRAAERLPGVAVPCIQRMLRNVANGGQLVFREGEGRQVVDGEPSFPVHVIDDPVRALELAQQLLQVAQRALQGEARHARVSLSFGGDVMICE